ncbi:galactokinase [Pseudoflavonifractor sp. 60]|uniref:galactokinase n=1 Tax=Pseudoflavonifractor sp. 60 TaxID=2304576 RepID=UPI00136DD507|nr:galactokinase family protein [Pseudoflavonifractor sp. 60]NBI65614.1 galactokinase [Pseudoflavonifractor sp. 60]
MSSCTSLLEALQAGAHDKALAALYALDGRPESLDGARRRACHVVQSLMDAFSPAQNSNAALFSGPGRTEIGGNHTDHQHGHVLCGSVDMDMLACAVPNGGGSVRILSEGYPALEVSLDDLEVKPQEANTSAALVRGVAAKVRELGYPLAGFDAYVSSTVLSGSGLSSSAAYETLVGNIFNHFCCGGALDPVTIAKIGQYAENVYFGKPCGLMDQMGSSVGGAVFIDFNDPANPVVERVDYDFTKSGHVLCIVDTASSHGDLTDDYADITREMGAVAAHFGKKVLREVPLEEYSAAIPALRKEYGDRAVLRAMHFYGDDCRAVQEAAALKAGTFEAFLNLVNASGHSSSLLLQNTWSIHDPRQQAIPLALTTGEYLLDGMGAIRVHGGGFAGTIQAFVPEEYLTVFKTGMEKLFGEGKCHVLHIRPQGGCVVAE